ncbi:uncharacterized protein EKO05_0000706 [Ascochyta rabiei]|uniref:uncharacterized protein n=1 Tax=Didymella rabiei TaxID=5454 RepID=UPI0022029C2D|nr:uncharacterized protein EKO05_0000706 [Ascochyta rabiei]UPX10030.1 hypothetical protein EKO05_0000706 [Ascochyta rabiei]
MSSDSAPRMVRVLAPRMSPIVTDGTVSIVLTDDYRLSPYMRDGDPDTNMPRTIIPEKLTTRSASVPLQYALGINLDAAKIWLEESLPDGFRAMDPNWVLFFDCNPDLMLARSVEDQNAYLATRDHLGLPVLRWAADLRYLAERQACGTKGSGEAV